MADFNPESLKQSYRDQQRHAKIQEVTAAEILETFTPLDLMRQKRWQATKYKTGDDLPTALHVASLPFHITFARQYFDELPMLTHNTLSGTDEVEEKLESDVVLSSLGNLIRTHRDRDSSRINPLVYALRARRTILITLHEAATNPLTQGILLPQLQKTPDSSNQSHNVA